MNNLTLLFIFTLCILALTSFDRANTSSNKSRDSVEVWAKNWQRYQEELHNFKNKRSNNSLLNQLSSPISCDSAHLEIATFATYYSTVVPSSVWMDRRIIETWKNYLSSSDSIDGFRVYMAATLDSEHTPTMILVTTRLINGKHEDYYPKGFDLTKPKIYNYNDPCPPDTNCSMSNRLLSASNACEQ